MESFFIIVIMIVVIIMGIAGYVDDYQKGCQRAKEEKQRKEVEEYWRKYRQEELRKQQELTYELFRINILGNKDRSAYYWRFLEAHGKKVVAEGTTEAYKNKAFCVDNLNLLDEFIKQEKNNEEIKAREWIVKKANEIIEDEKYNLGYEYYVSIGDIKEISGDDYDYRPIIAYEKKFEDKTKEIAQRICVEFEKNISSNKDRSTYYGIYLLSKGILEFDSLKSKKICLEEIHLLDLFISKEKELYKSEEQRKIEKQEKQEAFLRIVNAVSSWQLKVKGIPYYFFYNYYPARFTDISIVSKEIRHLIYDFKNGKRHNIVYNILSQKLKSTFYEKDLKHLCFVCIPASSKQQNEIRYEDFSNELCSALGMVNGYPYIKIVEDKTSVRDGGNFISENLYDINSEFFNGKFVVLFDDVVTRGRSMQIFKELLENKGAIVMCALSIGRTYSDYYGDHREPHPWNGEY